MYHEQPPINHLRLTLKSSNLIKNLHAFKARDPERHL